MVEMLEARCKLIMQAHRKSSVPRTGDEQNSSLHPCPMLHSLDAGLRRRHSPCYVVAMFLHGLILVPVFLQIHHAVPVLAEHIFAMREISVVCPAARRESAVQQTKRSATPPVQTSGAAAVRPAELEDHAAASRITRPVAVDTPTSAIMSNVAWTPETMTPAIADARFAAHGTVVSLASAGSSSAASGAAAESASASGESNRWEARLMSHIAQFRRYPEAARKKREQGVVYLWFRMDRNGNVLSARVDKSSGSPVLDQEALATLNRAQPLPRVPADRPSVLELELPIEYHLVR